MNPSSASAQGEGTEISHTRPAGISGQIFSRIFYYSSTITFFGWASFDHRHSLIVPDWDSAKNPRHSCVRNFLLWEVSRTFSTLPRCVSPRPVVHCTPSLSLGFPIRQKFIHGHYEYIRTMMTMDNKRGVVTSLTCLYVNLANAGIFCGPGGWV